MSDGETMPTPTPKMIITWEGAWRLAYKMAEVLQPHKKFNRILAVARGGWMPAAMIGRAMGVNHISYVEVSSYSDDDHKQGSLKFGRMPPADFANSPDCLVVDDVADTGKTFKALHQLWPRAFLCAMVSKPAAQNWLHLSTVEVPQDTWVEFPWETAPNRSKPVDPYLGQLLSI